MIDTTATVGELVAQHPARAALFERLGIDFCCGGSKTLAAACADIYLEPIAVARLIDAFDPTATPANDASHDIAHATLTEICDHIVEAHHDRLRRDLPEIAELLESVIRVHGPVHPWLHELVAPFAQLRDELEPHLDDEEQVLFAACRALDAGTAAGAAPIDAETLAAYAHEHDDVATSLKALRALTHDYDETRALCRTHRRLLAALHALERDLHLHVHEENNVLFPRVAAALAGSTGAGWFPQ